MSVYVIYMVKGCFIMTVSPSRPRQWPKKLDLDSNFCLMGIVSVSNDLITFTERILFYHAILQFWNSFPVMLLENVR